MDYHVTMYTAYQLVGIELQNLWKSFSLFQKSKYYMRLFYLPHFYPLSLVRPNANKLSVMALENILEAYQKKGKEKMKTGLKYTIF